MDSGAYNGNPAGIPAFMATACYKLTDARSTGRSVYTNKPKIHAYRAPSIPQVTLGLSSRLPSWRPSWAWIRLSSA
jgi:CO/xanthine dehydrogenase Mo-binding subunit